MCNNYKLISIPYSGKFSEGKIFGNLPFTNTSEINFRKPSAISNLSVKEQRILRNIFSEIVVFFEISKNFSLLKFPAIWYQWHDIHLYVIN